MPISSVGKTSKQGPGRGGAPSWESPSGRSGADPLVCAGPPGPAARLFDQALAAPGRPTGASARRPGGLPHTGKGVTLIEMMVVAAIIGLIAAISFPSASAGIESVRLVSATDSVATFLNGAVNRVERRQ